MSTSTTTQPAVEPVTVNVYSKTTMPCTACDNTKRWLKKYEVEYVEHDIETDEHTDLAKSRGHMQAPMVTLTTASGEILKSWHGFNPLELTTLLPVVEKAAA